METQGNSIVVKRVDWKQISGMRDDEKIIVDVIKLSVCLSMLEQEDRNFDLVFKIYRLFGDISQKEKKTKVSICFYQLTVKEIKHTFNGIQEVKGINTKELFLAA